MLRKLEIKFIKFYVEINFFKSKKMTKKQKKW